MAGKDTVNIDKNAPNWRQKPVYTAKFKSPTRNITIEELQNQYPDKSYQEIEVLYEAYPRFMYMYLPEEEIEKNEHILS